MKRRGITQVGIIVKDIHEAVEHYWDILGIGPWSIFTFNQNTLKNFTVYGKPVKQRFEFLIAKTMFGNVDVELMQYIEGPNIYKKFIKEKGFGLHHVKEQMDDVQLEKTLRKYKEKGIEVLQSGQFGENLHYYLDTEPFLGIYFEIGNFGKIPEPDRRYPPE